MRSLMEYVARSLVENPEQVRINQIDGDQSVVFELQVAPDDMGKIIGKQGRVANAMRVLLKAAAAKQGKRAMLEII